MKLREFNFNSLKSSLRPVNLAIKIKGSNKWYEGCSIGETLNLIPIEFADMEIKETRWFFDTFVIELECPTDKYIDTDRGKLI